MNAQAFPPQPPGMNAFPPLPPPPAVHAPPPAAAGYFGAAAGAPGLNIADLLTELDKVVPLAPQPDIGQLLGAVNQVAPDVVENLDADDRVENLDEDMSETEDSATEDTEYDPFDVEAGGGASAGPGEEGEDEGIVEALFDMLRSAEQVAPALEAAPAPKAKAGLVAPKAAPAKAAPAASPTKESKRLPSAPPKMPIRVPRLDEEEQPKPKAQASSYVFNAATQRWEPKKVARAPEPSAPPKAAPASSTGRRAAPRPAAHIFVDDQDEEEEQEQAQPPRRNIIAECEAEARADAASGQATYPQALAVRLALRFESNPQDMLKTMEEAGLPAAKDQRSTVKAIMRMCHPDKCKHALAKRAMQALVPLLS